MAIEILAKRMPMYANENTLTPLSEEVPVWTPVQLVIFLPSGVGMWRIIGGLFKNRILYIERNEPDVFMSPGLQGGDGTFNPHLRQIRRTR